jgi:uncharacterized cupin superfamily protein
VAEGLALSEGVVVRAPERVELAEETLAADQVTAGAPTTSDGEIARSSRGDLVTGVWRCTPGSFRDVEADETFVVLSGRATIEPAGGDPVDVGPGDVCVLAEGTVTSWTVHEELTKVYVIREG